MAQQVPCAAVLPTLFSSEDAVVLQKLLYDAVILVDHSFLSSGRWFQPHESYFRNLVLLWSLVADNAIQFAREICDQDRLTAYVNAFSKSQLPSELLKWISIRAGTEENLSNPKLMTPKALIKWLFVLEDQGLWVFDHEKLMFDAKAAICISRSDCFLPEVQPRGWTARERESIGKENAMGMRKWTIHWTKHSLMLTSVQINCLLIVAESAKI